MISIDQQFSDNITLLAPFFQPSSRTYWVYLVIAAVIALLLTLWRYRSHPQQIKSQLRAAIHRDLWFSPSSLLDVKLLCTRLLLIMTGLLPELAGAWTIATGIVKGLDRLFGIPALPAISPLLASAIYTVILFLAWDFSRYFVHRCMHAIPALWAFHQVHHSATVLTPLTFFRVHPIESLLFRIRGMLTTGVVAGLAYWALRQDAVMFEIAGIHVVVVLLTALFGNLRHSHVWLSFGPIIECWFISPAQHQLHHKTTTELQNANYGTWLSLWDRLGGTLVIATPQPPDTPFGLATEDSNHHPSQLGSALFSPFVDAVRRR